MLPHICPPTGQLLPEEEHGVGLARMSPKPNYFRADSNLSMDSFNKYLMSTHYVLGTMVGADFKVS